MGDWLMSRPSILQISTAVALIVIVAFLWLRHEKTKRLRNELATAEQQSRLDAETTHQLDRYTSTATIIREKAQEAENAVRTAPGADAPLDPDNRRILCAELERVRGRAVCASEGPNDVP